MATQGRFVNTKSGWAPVTRRSLFLAAFLLFGHPSFLKADTVTLNSGEVLEGRIISETDTQIEMEASFYHGTIFSTREIAKSDIRSIVRETPEQKQEKAAYASLTNLTLNPNQELTKDQYATGIAAFEKFQKTFTNSTHTAEIDKRLADWQSEATNAASGKVKFGGAWVTPAEKQVQATQTALQSLKSQLADLQVQRAQLGATISTTQAKLAAAQAKLPTLQDSTVSTPGTTASPPVGRGDLAGRLTARVTAPQPVVVEAAPAQTPVPNPEKSQLQSDVTLYQQQISQDQATLASIDAKTKEIESQIPQREQDSTLALVQLSPKPSSAQDTHTNKPPPPPPAPEPTPPWYTRLLNWFHRKGACLLKRMSFPCASYLNHLWNWRLELFTLPEFSRLISPSLMH